MRRILAVFFLFLMIGAAPLFSRVPAHDLHGAVMEQAAAEDSAVVQSGMVEKLDNSHLTNIIPDKTGFNFSLLKILRGLFSETKSIIMSVYMLCGFANFASSGIQIGGIGALAPGKRIQLSKLGISALLAGTLAALMSATLVGVLPG